MYNFKIKSFVMLSLIFALALSGCGNKGPLKPADAPKFSAHG